MRPSLALESALQERNRQDLKWGEQNHNDFTWMAILMEEVGEWSKESLRAHFDRNTSPNLREEAVQVAAVALAIIESIDRRQEKSKPVLGCLASRRVCVYSRAIDQPYPRLCINCRQPEPRLAT
jgi:NTP pyrophosphatase (non-canonical NTP hydrolase)